MNWLLILALLFTTITAVLVLIRIKLWSVLSGFIALIFWVLFFVDFIIIIFSQWWSVLLAILIIIGAVLLIIFTSKRFKRPKEYIQEGYREGKAKIKRRRKRR